ncbi:MAG: hypothetical protein RL456_2435 [Pseudomonadota bacterium]|jgi:uncharacterized surface protein with fasciclin (FAS1) repeats
MKFGPWLTTLPLAALLFTGCATPRAEPDIATLLASSPQFSTLNGLVNQAGLSGSLREAGPQTLLAPTNEAFKDLPAKTLADLGRQPEQLRHLLMHHVVAGRVPAARLADGKIRTAAGTEIAPSRAGDQVVIDEAMVVSPDLAARNGVVHGIDRVLTPPKR